MFVSLSSCFTSREVASASIKHEDMLAHFGLVALVWRENVLRVMGIEP